MQKWIILIVVSIILIIGTIIVLNIDIETEYVPETEVSQTALRKTIVTLYFRNKENGEISTESRLIDSKMLLKDPYQELVAMLIEGPENQNYEKVIPDGTNIKETLFENGCVNINFNKELVENSKDENHRKEIIFTIYETLTELTEVNEIKVTIDGEENEELNKIILNIKGEKQNSENVSQQNIVNNTISNEVDMQNQTSNTSTLNNVEYSISNQNAT